MEREYLHRAKLLAFNSELTRRLNCSSYAFTHFYYYQLTLPFDPEKPFLRDTTSKKALTIVSELVEVDWKKRQITGTVNKDDVKDALALSSLKASRATVTGNPRSVMVYSQMRSKLLNIYQGAPEDFEASIQQMLYRYQTLCLVANETMQLALPQSHFDAYEFDYECFGSPINCHMTNGSKRYFSAFPDTDTVFGSLGSFFENWKLIEAGSTVGVHPPYQMDAIDKSLDIIAELIKNGVHGVISVPSWRDAPFYNRISKYREVDIRPKNDMKYESHGFDGHVSSVADICDTTLATF